MVICNRGIWDSSPQNCLIRARNESTGTTRIWPFSWLMIWAREHKSAAPLTPADAAVCLWHLHQNTCGCLSSSSARENIVFFARLFCTKKVLYFWGGSGWISLFLLGPNLGFFFPLTYEQREKIVLWILAQWFYAHLIWLHVNSVAPLIK